MNLTTLWISGLAISVFAAAIAIRATQRPAADPDAWRRLPSAVPVAPQPLPAAQPVPPAADHALERTYERAIRKDDHAKQEAAEALTDMRHARGKLANAPRDDETARAHWERSYRSAGLRFESASHERRKALLAIDGVRRALRAQRGGLPSRVSVDSSK